MNPIDLEIWQRSEADPHRVEYAGQRTAQEVFIDRLTRRMKIPNKRVGETREK